MFSCTNSLFNPDGTKKIDNELFEDKCIVMDKGNPPWLSPDIILTSSLGILDQARKGEPNTVIVRDRRIFQNPDGSACLLPDNVYFQLWVGLPSFNPPIASAVQVTGFIPFKPLSASSFTPIGQVSETWTAEEVLPPHPSDTATSLHRCLIARCYPSDKTPPTAQFCVGEDPHVAQRNIAIIPVFMKKLSLNFPIQTIGNNPEVPEAALIRTTVDRTPSEAVLKAILPSLERFPGYRRLAPILPDRFALRIPERLSPVVRDYTRIDVVRPDIPSLPPIVFPEIIRYINRDIAGRSFRFRNAIFNPEAIAQEKMLAPGFGRPTALQLASAKIPTYEADVQLPPGEVAEINLNIDLPASSQVGDAHVFHAMQINTNQQVVGGMTVIAVVVNPAHIEAADGLANKRAELVKSGYLAVFGSSFVHSQRRYAQCLRDFEYYLIYVIESCRKDSVQPLDKFLSGAREINTALGYSNSWFVTFYQSVKNNHGLTDEAATVANSYLDYAINFFA